MANVIPDMYICRKAEYTQRDFARCRAQKYYRGMRIAEIRKARGLSQTELAEMVGVEQPTISRLEKGNDSVTLRLVRQVAKALGVEVSDLFLDERTMAERALLQAFRSLPPDRQTGWLDMARALRTETPKGDREGV